MGFHRKSIIILTTLLVSLLVFSGCSNTPEDTPTPTETPTIEATPVPTSTATEVPTPKPTMAPVCTSWGNTQSEADELGWWNDVVFYELFVRSFYDSDGDGIGDFNGILSKLDYLNDGDPTTNQDLGIQGIWLMPINASPSYHGYDVSDYFAVNPEYGTMEDFKNLLEEAHQRGHKGHHRPGSQSHQHTTPLV